MLSIYFNVRSQYYTIPDSNFAQALNEKIPSCMNGNQLDTTCYELLQLSSLNLSALMISNLDGIQYFKSLGHLSCGSNQLTNLPNLPNSIYTLHCGHNDLTSLSTLPTSIASLTCDFNHLTSIPELPDNMYHLDCDHNMLTSLPELPTSLEYLSCHHNQLTALPEIPGTMGQLECNNNLITSLGQLPHSLHSLDCSVNLLTYLPELPSTLSYLACSNNQLNSLPQFNVFLFSLWCENNLIQCFNDKLPPYGNISNNLNTCVPNQTSYTGDAPLCTTDDSPNNPNGCLGFDELIVFPNPGTGKYTVKYAKPVISIRVSNMDGVVIVNQKNEFNGIEFDLSDEAKGIYILELSEVDQTHYIRLVKL
jgi:hypothetical protein